jgi:hypothetical protein
VRPTRYQIPSALNPFLLLSEKMAPGLENPEIPKINPRIRYNTIGGINGPLVILENVRLFLCPVPYIPDSFWDGLIAQRKLTPFVYA